MPLPNSAPISFSQLKNEFGQIGNPDFSEYYRGGLLVTGTSVNSSIPLSGTMNLSDFYGASEFMRFDSSPGFVNLYAATVNGTVGSASLNINRQGTIDITLQSGAGGTETAQYPSFWGTPTTLATAGDLYEIRAIQTSWQTDAATTANYTVNMLGVDENTTVTSWLTMDTARTISCTARNGSTFVEIAGTVEFRKKYSTMTTTSTSFTIYAESGNVA